MEDFKDVVITWNVGRAGLGGFGAGGGGGGVSQPLRAGRVSLEDEKLFRFFSYSL